MVNKTNSGLVLIIRLKNIKNMVIKKSFDIIKNIKWEYDMLYLIMMSMMHQEILVGDMSIKD